MKTRNESPASHLPLDLSTWCGKDDMIRHVYESVHSIPLKVSDPNGFSGCSPKMLLTLVTYCYATGVYSSQEIETETKRNAVVGYLCARTFPSWEVILEFRRQYRDSITAALVQVFAGAWQTFLQTHYSEPIRPLAVDLLIQEAQRRYNRAVFLDSIAMDD